ncbi:MAG: winged helix-turn-helix domain-containing protein [Actinomycetes bacterium]
MSGTASRPVTIPHARTPRGAPGRLVALVPLDEVPAGVTVLATVLLDDREVTGPGTPAAAAPPLGPLVDEASRTASVDGRLLSLTKLEFDLLALFVRTPRRVHTRERLQESVWNGPAPGGSRTVDVHVHRLRHKLGDPHGRQLVTLRGVGYRWDPAG